jgi:regulator of ribonuclease activity A
MNAAIVTADLFDAHPDSVGVCDLQFRSYGKRRSFFGACKTLKVFEDHVPVLEALQAPGAGSVLVVDAGGSLRVGVLGDRLAEIGARNGWAGVIVFGAVRDSAGIDQLDFGVKALGTTARRAQMRSAGHSNIAVRIGGVEITPQCWVYADVDSVIVSPKELDLQAGSPQAGAAASGPPEAAYG